MQSRAVERSAAVVVQQVPREQQETIRVPLINGGIRSDKAACDLQVNEVVTQEALHVVAGKLVVDTGYVQFSAEYIGTAQAVFQARYSNGTSETLLITTQTVYYYEPGIGQWQFATRNLAHTTTTEVLAGGVSFDIDDPTDLNVNDLIGIFLDSGVQHPTSIASIVGNTITFNDAIAVGDHVTIGNLVYGALSLNGDPTISQVSVKLFSGNDWVIFCNGINHVMYYDARIVADLPGLTDTSCKTIEVFHECVLIANLVEGGQELTGRVRMSDAADPEEWTPGNGIAAIYDLIDTEDDILCLKNLGPWLIAYREQTIMRANYIGAPNETLFWEYMVRKDGAQSQGAVVDVGNTHLVVGQNNVYSYTGNYDLTPVGEGIFANFLAKGGDLNPPAKRTIFTWYTPALKEVWVFYPVGTGVDASTLPNKMLRFNMTTGAWSTRTYPDTFVSANFFTAQESQPWLTAPGTWQDAIWARPWNSRTLLENVPNIFLCPGEGTHLFVYDYAALTDNGTTIEWELTTKDFGDGAVFWRWEDVVFLGTGAVDLEHSEDEGETWSSLGSFDMGAGVAREAVPVDHVSTRMMLRLSGDDATFQLRYMHVNRVLETEW